MRFYVEYTETKGRRKVSLLDTESAETNIELEKIFNVKGDPDFLGYMIEIEYQSPAYQGLMADSWYDIDEATLKKFTYTLVGPNDEGGVYLRARMAGPAEDISFSTMLLDKKEKQ